MDRNTDTQTHKHTDTQTHRHTDTQTHRHTDTQTHRHTDTQTHRHTYTQTYSHRHRHTDMMNRPKDGQTVNGERNGCWNRHMDEVSYKGLCQLQVRLICARFARIS
jgi:hypothetical protein